MTTLFLSATELGERYRRGELSPVEVTRACLGRIRELDDRYRAFCLVDEDTSIEAARRSEERWRRGDALGPLDGVPVAIKDVLPTRGWVTRKGSRLTEGQAPAEVDAPAVAALRRGGFVPIGKTTTPELGWKGVTDSELCGATTNPWDPDLTAGGSSGGSATAVALGMAPLALGTDGGGSIRIPAGFSGIVGVKPTHGRVPMWPPSPFGNLAHVGPMTWTVRDAALLLDVLAESDARDATLPPCGIDYVAELDRGVRGLRVAFSPRLGYAQVDTEVAALVAAAARVFEELGAIVDEVDPGFSCPVEAFETLWYAGAALALAPVGEAERAELDPGLAEIAEAGARLSGLEVLQARARQTALIEQLSLFHCHYDLILTPTLPITAFAAGREVPEGWPHRRWHSWTPFTYPFNLTGQPAASVPCGFTVADRPVGLQIVGPRHGDAAVLRAAHAYQCARPLTARRPA